eukprot:Opistho-1_new@75744
MRYFLLFFVLFVCTSHSKAQNTLSSTNKKAIEAYQKGLKALQERNIEMAFNEFEEAIEKDNLFAEPYFHLAKLYEQSRQFGNAILNYEKAVNAQEKSSVTEIASQQVGQLYLKKGDY